MLNLSNRNGIKKISRVIVAIVVIAMVIGCLAYAL